MKLSVITINFNNREGLKRTFESVFSQTSKEFEYIVIDGGSTDGSVDLIHQFSSIINIWVSESDKGIYNAMNKGVRFSHGEYCNFLNSGDMLNNPDVIKHFNECNLTTDIICGIERLVTFQDGEIRSKAVNFPHKEILTDIFLTSSIGHGNSFIKTKLLLDNPYDESLKIVSDWKFFLEELIVKNRSYSAWNTLVNDFDTGGISNVQRNLLMKEREAVINQIAPPKLVKDYLSLIEGRTRLQTILRHEREGGLLEKCLTMIAEAILKISKIIRYRPCNQTKN